MQLFEEDAAVLGALAQHYDENSKEHLALKHASIALWYVLLQGHEKFRDYIAQFGDKLTPDQRSHLAEMGIDPETK